MTKTGKMTRADRPKRRSAFESFYRWSLWTYLWNARWNPWTILLWWRVREVEDRLVVDEPEEPWHGLPEAELSESQEHAAQEKLSHNWHHNS
jgi:hypothetical protein